MLQGTAGKHLISQGGGAGGAAASAPVCTCETTGYFTLTAERMAEEDGLRRSAGDLRQPALALETPAHLPLFKRLSRFSTPTSLRATA